MGSASGGRQLESLFAPSCLQVNTIGPRARAQIRNFAVRISSVDSMLSTKGGFAPGFA